MRCSCKNQSKALCDVDDRMTPASLPLYLQNVSSADSGPSFEPLTLLLPRPIRTRYARLTFIGDDVEVNQLGIGVIGELI